MWREYTSVGWVSKLEKDENIKEFVPFFSCKLEMLQLLQVLKNEKLIEVSEADNKIILLP